MTELGRVVAIVPARGGSVRLPGKNLAEVGGRSLVARAVQVGREVPAIQEVIVSSDDDDVLSEGERHGATPERRAPELATSTAPTQAVLADLLVRREDIGTLVVLQPTSPLRVAGDVTACLEALAVHEAAATVTPCDHRSVWTMSLSASGTLLPRHGRWADLTATHVTLEVRPSGAVYAARARYLRAGGPLLGPQTAGVLVPRARSIDIDDAFDLHLARLLTDHPFVADEQRHPS